MTGPKLKKLGKVQHISDLANAIIFNPPKLPKIGSEVVNEKMVHVGIVKDIFGPVKTPYVSVKLKPNLKEGLQPGTVLYSLEKKSRVYPMKKKRRKK
ncbi:MAG: H/ACA ribonucleoprotein complex subunit GAR1 [Candidatus Heimdallarchaeaceae archaeon]